MNRIEFLRETIKKANYAYYFTDKAILTDFEYDEYVEELAKLSPDDDIFKNIGVDVKDLKDAVELPVNMGSMVKIKKHEDLSSWLYKYKNIDINDEYFILTPKYNGMSFLTEWFKNNAYTRGDGFKGFLKNGQFNRLIKKYNIDVDDFATTFDIKKLFTTGEIITSRKVFEKYNEDFELVLNLITSVINSDYKEEFNDKLDDIYFMQYNLIMDYDMDKDKQLEILNKYFNTFKKVEYEKVKLSDMTEEFMAELYKKWSSEFEIDGIIVEFNNSKIRNQLGMSDVKLVPNFARAYKVNIEEVKDTIIDRIEYNIGKYGVITPVAYIKPIKLDGAVVNKVTCCNITWMQDRGINEGAEIKMRRSGMIIPQILKVNKKSNVAVIDECPSCKSKLQRTKTNLICTNPRCHEQRIKKNISFFEILEVKDFGEATIRSLYENGFDSIKKILEMKVDDFLKLEGFQKSKATKSYETIRKHLMDLDLCKLQHASSLFPGLGSRKLKLFEEYYDANELNIAELVKIDGISDISANVYINGITKFKEFFTDIKDYVKLKEKVVYDGDLNDKVFVFTGIRRKDLEKIIIERGGIVSDSISKKTSFLIMKEVGSGSKKEKTAQQYGTTIMTVNELEELLNK